MGLFVIKNFSPSLHWRLGKQSVWLVWVSLGLCLVYSLFYLAEYFGSSFFVLAHRGMVEHIVRGSLVSTNWDVAVWAGSVFVVIACLFYGLVSRRVGDFYRFLVGFVLVGLAGWVCLVVFGLIDLVSLSLVSVFLVFLCVLFSLLLFGFSRFHVISRLVVCVISVVLFVEVAALVLFNIPVALNFSSGATGLHWSIVELSFSNLAYPFLPYVYLLFVLLGIVGFALKVAPERLTNKIRRESFDVFVDHLRIKFELGDYDGFEFLKGRFVLAVAVLIGAVISCLFVVFTVLSWSNPTHMLVSVDSPIYYQWIVYMRSVDVNSALLFAFGNDRALFLVLGYALSFLVSPLVVVQFVAALLIVAFGAVSLLVLRLLCKFRVVWFLGVLLVPFSFQALGLIYSGYFASMLALILVLIYVILFFRVVGSFTGLSFFALLGVSVLILFSHSWIWFIFALSLGTFLFLEWRSSVHDTELWSRFKLKATVVGATIGVGLLCDFIRKMLFPVSASASVFVTVQSNLGLPNGSYILNGLQNNVDFVLGGVFANQLLVFLSVVGLLFLLKFKSEVSNFFISWVFVGCICILFASENLVFDRLLFLMPWVVLYSFGLFYVVSLFSSRLRGGKGGRLGFAVLVLVFVFLVLLNGSLRYLFNINIL
jgi:hypothetical protein